MTQFSPRQSFRKVAFLVLLGALGVLGFRLDVLAQEGKKQDRAAEEAKAPGEDLMLRSLVRAGYTRPGNPPDPLTEAGTVRRVSFETEQGIGGTVYFMVLQMTGAEGDTWGTGLRN